MSTTKYNPGDKVTIREHLMVNHKYGEHYVTDGMIPFCGKTVTIQRCISDDTYAIEEDVYYWTSEMFEEVSEDFTMADIENGMILETKSGVRFIVLGDSLVGLHASDTLSHFTFTLEHNIAGFLTIVKVYESENAAVLSEIFDDKNLKLIWERK